MDLEILKEAVAAPLSQGEGIGQPAEELFEFDEIDVEYMKRGTLAHSEVDWPKIAKKATNLLAHYSKDLMLVEIACYALMQGKSVTNLTNSLFLFDLFLAVHGSSCHPKSEKRRIQTIDRCINLFRSDLPDKANANLDQWVSARDAFLTLMDNASKYNIDQISRIKSQLERIQLIVDELTEQKEREEEQGAKGEIVTDGRSNDLTDGILAAPVVHFVDGDNERQFRKTLFTVSDYILATDLKCPLSYQLRRYALWFHIDEPPPLKKDNISVIAPAGESVINLLAQTDLNNEEQAADLVRMFERTINNAPFWLQGHVGLIELLKQLNAPEAAQAIAISLRQFIDKLPDITELLFSNEVPFIEPASLSSLMRDSPLPEGINDLQSAASGDRDSLTHMLEIDSYLGGANSKRDKFMGLVHGLEAMRDNGMDNTSKLLASALYEQASPLTAPEWDAPFFSKLEQFR